MNCSDKSSCSGDRHSVAAFIEGAEANDGIETIKGSDIPVWKVVKLHLEGSAIEDIVERFSDLSEKQVRGAVSYYYCHRRRITRQTEESEEVD